MAFHEIFDYRQPFDDELAKASTNRTSELWRFASAWSLSPDDRLMIKLSSSVAARWVPRVLLMSLAPTTAATAIALVSAPGSIWAASSVFGPITSLFGYMATAPDPHFRRIASIVNRSAWVLPVILILLTMIGLAGAALATFVNVALIFAATSKHVPIGDASYSSAFIAALLLTLLSAFGCTALRSVLLPRLSASGLSLSGPTYLLSRYLNASTIGTALFFCLVQAFNAAHGVQPSAVFAALLAIVFALVTIVRAWNADFEKRTDELISALEMSIADLSEFRRGVPPTASKTLLAVQSKTRGNRRTAGHFDDLPTRRVLDHVVNRLVRTESPGYRQKSTDYFDFHLGGFTDATLALMTREFFLEMRAALLGIPLSKAKNSSDQQGN